MTQQLSLPKPGFKRSVGSKVFQSALEQLSVSEPHTELGGYAEILAESVRIGGETAEDYYEHSTVGRTVARAFEMFKPDAGPEHDMSVDIAQAAVARMAQVFLMSVEDFEALQEEVQPAYMSQPFFDTSNFVSTSPSAAVSDCVTSSFGGDSGCTASASAVDSACSTGGSSFGIKTRHASMDLSVVHHQDTDCRQGAVVGGPRHQTA